ncbi:hypothetical protein HBI13_120060 [Parastagonospora nodorum]|nr:hypothetical protein HBI10_146910 [Parastagonospora nodorum]KAH4019954.1 hypothetical protein HBI13_120060 [Parastagonospora nodorum]KAH5721279.1 hypothetical protein HBI20_101150 [Parastagonospora nodorum]KAH6430319.1 hypothetical protein HBI08_037050 [Parastagonospora nodorum]KAH6456399.1 hypothetical protein HBI57_123500 [Parastagonospora nodorum]
MRKRTKTGCLTCRKRRIRCGEERPLCLNCIKTKRLCEGYNQRVVFKTPIENWPSGPGNVGSIEYPTSTLHGNQSYHTAYATPQPHEPLIDFDFPTLETSDFINSASGRRETPEIADATPQPHKDSHSLTDFNFSAFEMNYSSSSSFQRQDISDIAMKGGNSIVTSTDTLGVTIKDDSISATDDEEHAVPSDKTTGFRGYVWKINRLLDNFTCGTLVRLKSTEDPLQDGYVRLRWQCRCGEKFSGDVMEYREGGVARLIERMEQTTGARIERNPSATIERTIGAKIAVTPYKEAKATQRYTFRYPSWIQASAEKTSSALGYPTNSLLGLPQHGASGATTAYAPQAMGLQIPQQTLHLMACMQRGRYQRTVYQDRIDDITTDQALFSFMRKQVAQYRGKVRKIFSMKCIQGMYFVKFRLRAGGSAEVRNHEPCCTSSHPQICECIPPAMKVEPSPDAEYRCAPAGPLDNWPPVLSEELMHMLTSPQCINPKETFVLEQLPKRTRGELIGTIGRPAEGWGIHFQEGWDFDLLIGIVLAVFLLASLLFAVLWSHFKLDVQGAFGVSSYMVTASGIFVAWFANRAGKLG